MQSIMSRISLRKVLGLGAMVVMPQVVARLDVLQRLQKGRVLRIAQACKLVLKPLCSGLGLQHSIRLILSLHHPNAS